MDHVWLQVLVLTVLLAVAVLMLPIANRLQFPYTVLLALLGCTIGAVQVLVPSTPTLGIISDFMEALRSFEISSEAILFVFLPALVFGSALAIDVRRLMDDIAPILLLAVLGLLISTFVVGYTLWVISSVGLVACLLLGAIVSATDPVAVVAIFEDIGAPKRLATLVEGESLFNDATAIVLFTLLAAILTGAANPGFVAGAWSFVKVFVGGIVVGYLMAQATCMFMAGLRHLTLVKITLTISLAYLSFIVAEHYLHVSGVMAVVTAALVVGSTGRTAMSPRSWQALTTTWEQLGFWANSLIFVFVGLIVPKILSETGMDEFVLLVGMILAAFSARALVLFGVLPTFGMAGIAERVSAGYKTVMLWGGLRGAVSLALALAIVENQAVPPEIRTLVGILVTGFVVFTLFVNATTIRPLLSAFGLDQLSDAELAVRNRAMALTLEDTAASVQAVSEEYSISPELSGKVSESYRARAEGVETALGDLKGVGEDEWVRFGLGALANREREHYLDDLANGYVEPSTARHLLSQVDDLFDGLKINGNVGYRLAYERTLGFGWRFRAALRLHRQLGWTRFLTRRLVDRFEILLAQAAALRAVTRESLSNVSQVVGREIGTRLEEILEVRLLATTEALTALERQYPEYTRTLQRCHLERIALRLEEADYDDLYEQGVIGGEVWHDLKDGIEARHRAAEALPRLDLNLKPAQLVARVPFFAGLDVNRIAQIAGLLKSRLAVPGELIIRQGDIGDAMYFIACGAVDVALEGTTIQLGSGDFFGEIALVAHRPRVADVTAQAFCDLLVLNTHEFQTLLERLPELRQTIDRVAEERLKADGLFETTTPGEPR